jgi:lipoprotein-releasing system permease protein
MTTAHFLARRIHAAQDREKRVSPPAIRIAVVSMALSVAIMILTVAIVTGFKHQVSNKITGFNAHILVTHFDNNASHETQPIALSDSFMRVLQTYPGVSHAQVFATKPAILKTPGDYQAIILKGVDRDYDWNFLRTHLTQGEIPAIDTVGNQILLSAYIADKLNLRVGDAISCYFIQSPPRVKRYQVVGIYQTYLTEYDQQFAFVDIRQIRQISDWAPDMATGVELTIANPNVLDTIYQSLYYPLAASTDRFGSHYLTRTIDQLQPAIFSWLDVLDTNVILVFVIMTLVAGFAMISSLLILILERASLIGILKALGAGNRLIRHTFLRLSVYLITKGLLLGNALAILLILVQKMTGIIKLDPNTYYLPEVPVELSLITLLIVNAATLVVTILLLLGPSYSIARIHPAKTIQFE